MKTHAYIVHTKTYTHIKDTYTDNTLMHTHYTHADINRHTDIHITYTYTQTYMHAHTHTHKHTAIHTLYTHIDIHRYTLK